MVFLEEQFQVQLALLHLVLACDQVVWMQRGLFLFFFPSFLSFPTLRGLFLLPNATDSLTDSSHLARDEATSTKAEGDLRGATPRRARRLVASPFSLPLPSASDRNNKPTNPNPRFQPQFLRFYIIKSTNPTPLQQPNFTLLRLSGSSASPPPSSPRRSSPRVHRRAAKTETRIEKSRAERWKITGVVTLSECQLREVPDEVWGCGSSIRALDLSTNFIQQIPLKISDLKSINKLLLNGNDLSEDSIYWEGLLSLKLLSFLSLNNDGLTALPSALGSLTSLHQLHLAFNNLTALPTELASLTQLEVLKANNNRINLLPLSIGNCKSLIEIDLSSNLLTELPETLGNLYNLKALYLKNNGVRTLPPTLFEGCRQLSILDLHGTEITNDVLRQIKGWEDFDERWRSKHQKQLDFRVGSSGVFDEGADDNSRGH